MINGRVSPDGALFALDETAPPGTTCMGGQALTPAGVAYVANNVLAEPPYFTPNGFKTDANGTLLVGLPPSSATRVDCPTTPSRNWWCS